MTWQGGKRGREIGPTSPFARLTPLAADRDNSETGLKQLAKALSNYKKPTLLHVRLVTGKEGERVEHWEINAGSKGSKLQRAQTKKAEVIVLMRPETWSQIAQGILAPYDALFAGKLRVGGNVEAAKDITRHLSDPRIPYVTPC
jgi:putative sterol carrier protein